MDKDFKCMKTVLTVDVLIAYPNHDIPFLIYTNASDYHMGAIIVQLKQLDTRTEK